MLFWLAPELIQRINDFIRCSPFWTEYKGQNKILKKLLNVPNVEENFNNTLNNNTTQAPQWQMGFDSSPKLLQLSNFFFLSSVNVSYIAVKYTSVFWVNTFRGKSFGQEPEADRWNVPSFRGAYIGTWLWQRLSLWMCNIHLFCFTIIFFLSLCLFTYFS